jgi:hypothetical protein
MNLRARRGVSLLEAIFALAIVVMTAIGALMAAGQEARTADRALRAHEAEALATERLAFLPLLQDRDLQNLPDTVGHGQFDWPLNEYSWETTSTTSPTLPGLYDIGVTIFWPGGSYSVSSAQYRRPVVSTGSR